MQMQMQMQTRTSTCESVFVSSPRMQYVVITMISSSSSVMYVHYCVL
jgi:hypothetical protein